VAGSEMARTPFHELLATGQGSLNASFIFLIQTSQNGVRAI
jgi:hypothetical protein